ncbi:THUMP domain-containing protein [Plasmodiophora brassicae]
MKRCVQRGGGRPGKRSKHGLRTPDRGMVGVLVTCERGREDACWREVQRLLDDVLDEHWSRQQEPETSENADVSVSDALDRELAELKEEPRNERVFRLNNFNITGTVFVQIAEASVDPVQVVEHIFERLNASKSPITKFVDRIIPLQLLCRANEEELNNALPEFIASKFTGIDESLTFACRVEKRHCPDLKTKPTIELMAGMVVPAARPVKLSDPDIVIMMQVMQNWAGVSVVGPHLFAKLNEFRLRHAARKLMADEQHPGPDEQAS